MNPHDLTENSYVLLTPGPLTTTKSVKAAMLRDWCTWDDDYLQIVQDIRRRLVKLATRHDGYTSALMQGSGTFSVEAVLGTSVPAEGKILILANGAYGERMAQIADRLRIPSLVLRCPETERHDPERVRTALRDDRGITHVALVHCETTTGILNDLDGMAAVVREADRCFIVDAMSSFGGIPMDAAELRSPFIISFLSPPDPGFNFRRFYDELKSRGFVIYPGKVSKADTFRIGTIGDVTPKTMETLLTAVRASLHWRTPA